MKSKLFMIGLELASDFPNPVGNLQKDILTFQKIQNVMVELFEEKISSNGGEKWDELLLLLLVRQKDYMEKMIYGDV